MAQDCRKYVNTCTFPAFITRYCDVFVAFSWVFCFCCMFSQQKGQFRHCSSQFTSNSLCPSFFLIIVRYSYLVSGSETFPACAVRTDTAVDVFVALVITIVVGRTIVVSSGFPVACPSAVLREIVFTPANVINNHHNQAHT